MEVARTVSRPDLDVVPADAADREAVANLMQLYLYDFSEFDPGLEIDDKGRFAYPAFDSYWRGDRQRTIRLFRSGGATVGFAFIGDCSLSGRDVDRCLVEFFVLRAYRRSGVGWEAAARLFDTLPGRWEVGVRGTNVPAVNFWRTALRAETIGDLEEIETRGERWTGTIFRFLGGHRALVLGG